MDITDGLIQRKRWQKGRKRRGYSKHKTCTGGKNKPHRSNVPHVHLKTNPCILPSPPPHPPPIKDFTRALSKLHFTGSDAFLVVPVLSLTKLPEGGWLNIARFKLSNNSVLSISLQCHLSISYSLYVQYGIGASGIGIWLHNITSLYG